MSAHSLPDGSRLSPRNRLLVALSVVLLLIAGAMFGFWLYWQHRFENANVFAVGQEARQAKFAPLYDEAQIKGTHLRDLWHAWAMQHKDEIRQMLKEGRPEDFEKVWKDLPDKLTTSEETGISHEEFTKGNIHFSWQQGGRHDQMPDETIARQSVMREKTFNITRNQDLYERYHDIALAQSMVPGKRMVCLWASGRMTEMRVAPRNVNGKSTYYEEHTEILPPFDEVKP